VQLCTAFEITRQALYKRRRVQAVEQLHEHLIVKRVHEVRRRMPRVGGRKLYHMLRTDLQRMHAKTLGRDKFFDVLRRNGLLVKRRKKYATTTNSQHRFYVYDNLLTDLVINRVNQVFVADITYIRLHESFCYLALVTDVSSRNVVGYDLSMSLSIDGSLRALRMALRGVADPRGLIHHSDRGIQYCGHDYTSMLLSKNCRISMGESGNPYDNAIAERVNGILKQEFLLDSTFSDFATAQKAVSEAIETYNTYRPHLSLDFETPAIRYAA
jgi:transposase InsO family protein